jgi:YgiT-type zinc finger domain-containing protein
MQCTVCGATLRSTTSDLPFKVREHTIVILKNLPVLECPNCVQYLIADREVSRVEQMLAQVNGAAELEILRYVA